MDPRTRQLQSAARRASARAEGVGSGRVALQERLAAQVCVGRLQGCRVAGLPGYAGERRWRGSGEEWGW